MIGDYGVLVLVCADFIGLRVQHSNKFCTHKIMCGMDRNQIDQSHCKDRHSPPQHSTTISVVSADIRRSLPEMQSLINLLRVAATKQPATLQNMLTVEAEMTSSDVHA